MLLLMVMLWVVLRVLVHLVLRAIFVLPLLVLLAFL